MARTVTKASKQALLASTALLPQETIAKAGDNLHLTQDEIVNLANDAFSMFAEGGDMQNNATQELAYAVMAWCDNLVRQYPNGDIPKLSALFDSPEATKKMMVDCGLRVAFLGKRPADKKKGDQWAKDILVYNKRNTMLSNAVKLASIFASHGMTIASYDTARKQWEIKSGLLFPADWMPSNPNIVHVLRWLDNGQAGGGGNENGDVSKPWFLNVHASVTQVLRVAKPIKERAPGGETDQNDDGDDTPTVTHSTVSQASVAMLVNDVEPLKLLAAFYQGFVEDAAKDDRLGLYDETQRNMLAAIRQHIDTLRFNEDAYQAEIAAKRAA